MNRGNLISLLIAGIIVSCNPENQLPVAVTYAHPGTGDTTTVFMLEGKNSSDKETSYFALQYRWDVDADGTWDTEFSARTSYTARFGKPGFQKFIMEVADDDGGTCMAMDSVFILSSNKNRDTITDPRDGHRYPIVKIGGTWWLAENLLYGKPIPYTTAQLNNDQVEYIFFNDNEEYLPYGGLYTWTEANYYPAPTLFRDICPQGWRIPTAKQWSDLFKNYPQPLDILYYFGKSSIENLGIELHGYYKYGDPDDPLIGEFKDERSGIRYWTSDFTGADTTRYFTAINFTHDSWNFVNSFNRTEWIYHERFGYIIGYRTPEACYVRCIKL